MKVQQIALEQLIESPFNPRMDFDTAELQELAADIAQRGVLQPILVRPVLHAAGVFEIVFGHRRYRAAKLVKLVTIPAMVQVLTDAQSLEAALSENIARADLHPLDEARALAALHWGHHVSVEDLAAKFGRSRSTIYGALKLGELVPKVQALFRAGKLVTSTALLVARIPDGKLQEKAAKEIAEGRYEQGPMSVRAAQDLVRESYMLELKSAPFDVKDAALLPDAGACTACPKRTGAQPELFKDQGPDVCTDTPCYALKVDAWWAGKQAASKAGGPRVLSATEAKKAFNNYGSLEYDSGFVEARSTCPDDPKRRPFDKLLGKSKKDYIVLARDPKSGKVFELLAEAGLRAALRDAGHDFKKERASDPAAKATTAAMELERKKRARAQAVAMKAVAAMVTIVEATEPDRRFWAFLASSFGTNGVADLTLERRCRLNDIKDPELAAEEEKRYLASVPKMDEGQLRGFVFEAVMEPVFYTFGGEPSKELRAAAEYFKIDLKELEAEVKAEEKAKGAEKSVPSPAPGVEKVRKAIGAVAKKAKAEARS